MHVVELTQVPAEGHLQDVAARRPALSPDGLGRQAMHLLEGEVKGLIVSVTELGVGWLM
jgi:hypothetical protein